MDVEPLVQNFLSTYLWPDDEWLERRADGFSYWQARIAQHVSASPGSDGWVKWRVHTPVVHGVKDPDTAVALCLGLNDYAAGWTMAFDASEGSIHALIALSAPPEWDRSMVRFAEAMKLCSWFCDALADRLSGAVGGTPAYSYPATQTGIREAPDAVNAYATVLRSRPEWVFDPTPFKYPDLEWIAAEFGSAMGVTPDQIDVSETSVAIATHDTSGRSVPDLVSCRFASHPLLGMGWTSQITFPWVPAAQAAQTAMDASWTMFADDHCTLMGSWVISEDELAFRQWSPTSELRSFEQLHQWFEHDAAELWGVTSTLRFSAQALAQVNPPDVTATPAETQLEGKAAAAEVVAAFRDVAVDAVREIPTQYDDRADRRLLWLERSDILLTCGWFNPSGPTLATLELCRAPREGPDLLVYFMRHPLLPKYVVIAEIDDAADLRHALADGLDEMFEGSPPNFVTATGCPEGILDDLLAEMERAAERAESDHDLDLEYAAHKIVSTMGQPWEWASIEAEDREAYEGSARTPSDAYNAWLEAATSDENVLANIMEFPQPWDGSLNFQASYNNLGSAAFDIGPFVVIYSSIGKISNPGG